MGIRVLRSEEENWFQPGDEKVIAGVRENVTKQCRQFPVYG